MRTRPSKVSRFHRVVQEIVAEYLRSLGFSVELEVPLDGIHVADVYAVEGNRTSVVEVETGYVPPVFLMSAEEYITARLAVKIFSYSSLADEFYIAFPSYMELPIPTWAVKCGPLTEDALSLVSKFYSPRQAQLMLESSYICRGLRGLLKVNISNRAVALEEL